MLELKGKVVARLSVVVVVIIVSSSGVTVVARLSVAVVVMKASNLVVDTVPVGKVLLTIPPPAPGMGLDVVVCVLISVATVLVVEGMGASQVLTSDRHEESSQKWVAAEFTQAL